MLSDPLLNLQHSVFSRGVELVVQVHVEHAEVQLPEHQGSRAIGPRAAEFLEQVLRQHLAGLVVPGDSQQCGPVVTPVLHELAGQFDSVPRYAIDARSVGMFDGRHHVLQAMAELVEQCLDFTKGHQ